MSEQSGSKAAQHGIHETIVKTMGKRIIAGTYAPGRAIASEAEIGQTFNASRTATREALKILSSKGLVEGRPKIGVIVRPKEYWNMMDPMVLEWALNDPAQTEGMILDLYALRMAIEPQAARLAARRYNVEDEAAIRRALRGMAIYIDINDRVEQDIAFHIAILAASGNRLFGSLGQLISVGLRHLFHSGLRVTNDEDNQWIERHKRVADALFMRDEDLVAIEMTTLLREARDQRNNP